MKRLTAQLPKIAAVMCLGLASLATQALELRGFRGLLWGDSASRLGPVEVVYTQGEVTCYKRERENLLFGDHALNAVRYCFHQDHLFMVALDSAVNQEKMVHEFQLTYGAPTVQQPTKAFWGTASTPVRAEVVAPGRASQLSTMVIYSKKHEPSHSVSLAVLPNWQHSE